MMRFAVGEALDPIWTKRIPRNTGGATLVMDQSTLMIMCGLPALRQEEIQAARHGAFRLGLYRQNDALVVMMKIADFVVFDLPYDHRVGPPHGRGYPRDRKPHEGFGVSAVIFDSITGVTKALRMASVTPQFSKRLEDIVDDLASRVDNPKWTYAQDIANIYSRFPRPNQIWPHCEIVEQCGIKFPKNG